MKIFWLVPLLTLMVPGMAAADACDKDRVTVCNDVVPGGGHVYDCLVGRQDQISPACASAVSRAGSLADAVVRNCQTDAAQWCAQYANAGRGAVIECLKSHKDKISETCKSKYRQFKAFAFDLKS